MSRSAGNREIDQALRMQGINSRKDIGARKFSEDKNAQNMCKAWWFSFLPSFLFFFLYFFETGSLFVGWPCTPYVVQAGLKLMTGLLPQPLESRDFRDILAYLAFKKINK